MLIHKLGGNLLDNLKSILFEYEQKRAEKQSAAERFKRKFYEDHPDVDDIDRQIATLSIASIQKALSSNNSKNINMNNEKIKKMSEKKKELLKKYKVSKKDFEPKYDCKKCNDNGYIMIKPGVSELCSCVKQKLYNIAYNNSNIYNLENLSFDHFRFDVYSDKPDPKKYNQNLSPRDNMKSIKKTCDNFIKNFDDPNQNNLLFCGFTGLGKTFLSSCIANEIIKKGKTVLYQTAPMMFDKILNYKFGKSDENIADAIYNVDLLIIDDLGTEFNNNATDVELLNIINGRLINQNNKITKTILSTNLALPKLLSTYKERIMSRIIGSYDACYFYGDDIRVKNK